MCKKYYPQEPEPELKPEPAPGKKFPGPEPPQNRPAPKPWRLWSAYSLGLSYKLAFTLMK